MLNYMIRRLLQIIPTLLGTITVVFVLVYLLPSDPMRAVLGDRYARVKPEVIAQMRHDLGFDTPLIDRYLHYVGQIVRGDLGRSYVLDQQVSEIIGYRFPRTLQLMCGAMLVAVLIGVPVGIVSAHRVGSRLDHSLTIFTLLVLSTPIFWLAMLAQLTLTQSKFGMALFPVAGYTDGQLRYLVLPALVLGTALSARLAQTTRAAMLEVRGREYIVTAYAKGLRTRSVVLVHQLRNALIPIITVISLDIGALFGGSVVTETIFNWPGLGRAIVPAIERRDMPVIMGVLILGAVLFCGINLLTDIAYILINPRIRFTR